MPAARPRVEIAKSHRGSESDGCHGTHGDAGDDVRQPDRQCRHPQPRPRCGPRSFRGDEPAGDRPDQKGVLRAKKRQCSSRPDAYGHAVFLIADQPDLERRARRDKYFLVEKTSNGWKEIALLPSGATSFSVKGLNANTTCQFKVAAQNSAGGTWSNVTCAKTSGAIIARPFC